MTDSESWIIDVDARSFEKIVVEGSFDRPIVLDLWAPWCEPCKILGPILEKRAREGGGRFLLAKVNIDASPELAQALRVQGVPAVIVLSKGKLVDGFEGALPEVEVDRFLDRVAPALPGGNTGSGEAGDQARALAEEGHGDQAIQFLREHLTEHPEDHAARHVLADLLVDEGQPAEARLVFGELGEEERNTAQGKALEGRIAFGEQSGNLEELRGAVAAAPQDFDARLTLGNALLACKDIEGGLEELLEAVRLAPDGRGNEAKAPMLQTFELLGLEDPIANDYRFKLSLELFA